MCLYIICLDTSGGRLPDSTTHKHIHTLTLSTYIHTYLHTYIYISTTTAAQVSLEAAQGRHEAKQVSPEVVQVTPKASYLCKIMNSHT